jgi:hypothetical protein
MERSCRTHHSVGAMTAARRSTLALTTALALVSCTNERANRSCNSPTSGPVPVASGTGRVEVSVQTAGPIKAGDEVKIVWLMSGAGDLQSWAISPTGIRAELSFGPTPHLPNGPLDEWGTGFVLTDQGCWEIVAARGDLSARVHLLVGE